MKDEELRLSLNGSCVRMRSVHHSSFIIHHSSFCVHHSSFIIHHSSFPNRAAVLVLVLWCVVILSILVLNLAFLTKTHVRITANYADTNALHNIAFAGVEFAVATIRGDTGPVDDFSDGWADGKALRDIPVGDGFFSLVRDGDSGAPEYGIEDEASKLNLCTATEETLMRLPGMTPELAQALLDWQDTDLQPHPMGAENDYYESLPKPRPCKNGKLTTLAELLLVKGFTPSVLYGEDLNGNGLLDPNEDDGDASPPSDNQDGVLDRGILPYVTIYSVDKNVTPDGKTRVNITQADESTLKTSIPGLSDAEAKAIVSYRGGNQFQNVGDLLRVTEPQPNAPQQQQPQQDEEAARRDDGGSRSGNRDLESRPRRGGSFRGRSPRSGGGSPDSTTPSQPAPEAAPTGKKVFTPDRLKQIISYCAIVGDTTTEGRINVNTASKAVLQTLPGMSETLAQAVVDHRSQSGKSFQSIAGLLDVPGITEEVFIPLSNQVTVRSFQFRVKSQARIEGVNAQRTAVAVLDRSEDKIKTVYWNEY